MINPEFKGKSFILVIPNDFGIYEVFNKNLVHFGFNLISVVPQEFKYRNNKQRVTNFLYKTFAGTRRFKERLIKEFHSENVSNIISKIPEKSIDYVLVIRPDTLEKETLDKLMRVGKKVVAYQWDGLDRFPKVFEYINMFENFLIFDHNDYEKYKKQYPNLKLTENFHFDYDAGIVNKTKSDLVYYIGSYQEDRVKDLVYIVKELEKYPLKFNINLRNYSSKDLLNEKHIKFFREEVDYYTNLERTKNSKIILDFKVDIHDGLSLRFFEAMKYEKKVITNNKMVLNYDFYDPRNIFIMHHDPIEGLGEFIKSDYKKLSPELVDKYSFSSWLKEFVL